MALDRRGRGAGRNRTRLKFPLLARRGRRRGEPRGKGRGGGSTANSGRGLGRDRQCARFYQGQPVLRAQPWPGGGARPSTVHRSSPQRPGGVSSDPTSQGHYPQLHLSPRPTWNPPQVPERRVGEGNLSGLWEGQAEQVEEEQRGTPNFLSGYFQDAFLDWSNTAWRYFGDNFGWLPDCSRILGMGGCGW